MVQGLMSPQYDNNGNMTRDEQNRTLTYDAWNRLVSVSGSPGVTHAYDALGRRVKETRGGAVTDLYYSDQWQVVEERTNGTPYAQYVWSPVYVDAMILRDRDANGQTGDGLEERLYVMQDANWNVTGVMTPVGNVLERYVYDPYGVPTVLNPTTWLAQDPNSYKWTYLHQGGRFDNASGLYSFRHRDLSPTLGRWIQMDPIRYAAEDLNLYRVVPVNRVDPTGLLSLEPRVGTPDDLFLESCKRDPEHDPPFGRPDFCLSKMSRPYLVLPHMLGLSSRRQQACAARLGEACNYIAEASRGRATHRGGSKTLPPGQFRRIIVGGHCGGPQVGRKPGVSFGDKGRFDADGIRMPGCIEAIQAALAPHGTLLICSCGYRSNNPAEWDQELQKFANTVKRTVCAYPGSVRPDTTYGCYPNKKGEVQVCKNPQ
jgi:RHS repeat-associated protein